MTRMNPSFLWKKTHNGRYTSTKKDTRIKWYHERFQERNDIPLKVTRAEWYQHGRCFINTNKHHGNRMEPQEPNGISKEEILLTWKVTRMK
jgi:hypothetical protein